MTKRFEYGVAIPDLADALKLSAPALDAMAQRDWDLEDYLSSMRKSSDSLTTRVAALESAASTAPRVKFISANSPGGGAITAVKPTYQDLFTVTFTTARSDAVAFAFLTLDAYTGTAGFKQIYGRININGTPSAAEARFDEAAGEATVAQAYAHNVPAGTYNYVVQAAIFTAAGSAGVAATNTSLRLLIWDSP